jgi:hypothetical protein
LGYGPGRVGVFSRYSRLCLLASFWRSRFKGESRHQETQCPAESRQVRKQEPYYLDINLPGLKGVNRTCCL